MKAKIALFCNVEEEAVIPALDVEFIYQVQLAFSRERRSPWCGVRLGMRWVTMKATRNVGGMVSANSTEFEDGGPCKVTSRPRDLTGLDGLAGTMRGGKYPCSLKDGSIARAAYGVE